MSWLALYPLVGVLFAELLIWVAQRAGRGGWPDGDGTRVIYYVLLVAGWPAWVVWVVLIFLGLARRRAGRG